VLNTNTGKIEKNLEAGLFLTKKLILNIILNIYIEVK